MVGHDQRTARYFEQNTPVYSLGRYAEIVEYLQGDARPGASLLDVGCGSGSVLKLIVENSPVDDIAGVDVSSAYLSQCAGKLPSCKTYLGSILDPELQATVGRRFRYVLVGAVLHHLVGSGRKESLEYAREGLASAWWFVEPDGTLILMEPTFRPHWLMSRLFSVKRLVSRITSGRVSLFGHWNNLGEPVVSYLSHEELVQKVRTLAGADIVLDLKKTKRLPAVWRLAGVTERADSVLVVRKSL
jgi:ubiquinone/menaquinone biosynthesis C-methylase UbiE